MTPKEKANELVSKFVSISLSQYVDLVDGIRIRLAKECALIAVDELVQWMPGKEYASDETSAFDVEYWQEVKQEIEAL